MADDYKNDRVLPPAKTIEDKDIQMGLLAYDVIEHRLRNNTATSQETTLFIKLCSKRESAERRLLEAKTQHAEAQTKSLKTGDELKELYEKAMHAYDIYSGKYDSDEDEN